MKRQKNMAFAALIYRILGFILSVVGIVTHLLADNVTGAEFMVRHKLAFFTIQTNVFVAVLFAVLIVRTVMTWKKDNILVTAAVNPSLQLAVTFYISMTMLGYWLLLVPFTRIPREPFLFINTMLLHTITPLLAIFDHVCFAPHGLVEKKDAFRWLAYPAVYVVGVMLYSQTITTPYYSFQMGGKTVELLYPYPFLDPNVLGPWGVAAAILGLCVLFYLLSRLCIGLDLRRAGTKRKN